jgi:hypothetical protein
MFADRESPSSAPDQEGESRWSNVLQEVHDASQTGRRWYQELGLLVVWAVGIGTSAALATLILLLIVDLFSSQRLLNGRTISDWLFWTSALLLFSGLLAPSASDLRDSTKKRNQQKKKKTNFAVTRSASSQNTATEPAISAAEKRTDAVRRRLQRVYNPWRWRIWASALVSFGFSMLAGLVASLPR